jgi:cyanophycinase
MIGGGSSSEALQKGAVIMKQGMGFIPELIIDTHFVKRGRFGRMAEAVAMFPNLIGVGLADDTGLIIKHCNEFKVIGSGMVVLFDPSHLTHNTHAILKTGTPMSMSNLGNTHPRQWRQV